MFDRQSDALRAEILPGHLKLLVGNQKERHPRGCGNPATGSVNQAVRGGHGWYVPGIERKLQSDKVFAQQIPAELGVILALLGRSHRAVIDSDDPHNPPTVDRHASTPRVRKRIPLEEESLPQRLRPVE